MGIPTMETEDDDTEHTTESFAISESYSDPTTAIRFLSILDAEQVSKVRLTVTANPSAPFRSAPPAGDGGTDVDDARLVGKVQRTNEADSDELTPVEDVPDSPVPGPSDGAGDDDEDTIGKKTEGGVRSIGRYTEIPDDAFVPKARHGSGDGYRYLRPGHSLHHTLYLVAVYQHENGENPTSRGLYEYFPDAYDSREQITPAVSMLCNQFDVIERDREAMESGGVQGRYWINDRGVRYLEEHGYPVEDPYAIPEDHRYEIQRVTEESDA